MFEATRQKVLLGLALGLLGAVVLDKAVVWPLSGYISKVNSRIRELSAEVAQARRLAETAPPAREWAAALRRLRLPTEQAQSEFRRYLEAQVGPNVEVTSSLQVSVEGLRESPDLTRITYDVTLLGSQEALRQALENLDASRELLRIEKLDVTPGAPEEPRLKAKVLVSALASTTAPPDSAHRPFLPQAGALLAAPAKNMFFPSDRLPGALTVGETIAQSPPAGEFVLAGTVISARRRAALLEFPASGEIRWVSVGEQAGQMTVADVRPDCAVFQLGGQQLALAVGRPGTDLLAGRRVLGGGFELVGVCRAGSRRFAMLQPDRGGKIQRVHVNDRLGAGVVAQISEDGIVLQVAGVRHALPVGGRFAGEADVQ